jgi:hypothetical protein
MTAQTWIDATRDMLLTDYVEEYATLAGTLTASASDTSVSFTLPAAIVPGIVTGATFEIGTELFYVYAVSGAGLATAQRGFRGSDVAAHSAGDTVIVNPKFPAYQILKALNDDLLDLASPQNGLFQIGTVALTYSSSTSGYDLTAVTDEILDIHSVTWSDSGSENAEPAIRKYALKRDRAVADFASGYALVLYDAAESGREILVSYKTSFTAITDNTTTLATVGLHAGGYDLPPLGAAMRLMATRPIRREFLDEQGFSRRSEEVPAGGPSASMRDLRALRADRVNAEATRLNAQYPTFWQRG